jgi:predicted aldo/keto reductase-like oxidoreductase
LKYRKFGSLDWEASVLGLGTARLPDTKRASISLIRAAIERGVNYLDLGYPYDLSRHERVAGMVGDALGGGYRDRVKVAVTLPSHAIRSRTDFKFHLFRQLHVLRTERADFCLFGRLNRDNWPALKALGALEWLHTAIRDGRIHNAGFSFHDHYQVLKSVVESWDRWALSQFQFSYMDIDHDPGVTGIKYAAGKGLAVVVTEPLKGGRLREWGLRFVWNCREVATAVRDVSSAAELKESADLAARAEPGNLSIQEEVRISKARDAYLALRPLPCPSCRGCMPCPEAIDVPRIFELYNDAFMYGDLETVRLIYLNEKHRADLCTECGACEKSCAKRLPVLEWLKKARRLLHQ